MDEKLKVCLLNDSFPPTIDGVSNTVFNYASIIQDKLGEAVVATPKYPNVEDDYDFEVVRYASFDTTGIIGYRAGYPFEPSVLGELESKNVDIIHTHCPAVSAILARTLRERADVPIVFTYHTKFDIDIKKALKSNLLQEASIKVIVNNIEACDEVWVVSEGAGENLRSLGYKGDYIVMENGVDFPRGKADSGLVKSIREEAGIKEGVPVFLFVGRLMWYKGFKITLDALKEVKESGLDFCMVIVGDGGDAREIKEYAAQNGIDDNCVFVGAVQDRELLRGYYTMADMFLFPTTYDTNGIVVREAAACGLGSVLIKGSCAAEGIEDRRNGYLIDENAPSMAEAVKELIANIDLAHKIGENAMNEIYIPWDESVRKAYERYKAVIAKYKSPEYERNTTFTDDALNSIAGICGALNKARKFRESVTNGFIDRSLAISGALIEKKNSGISYAGTHLENIKNGFAVKKAVFEREMEERKSMLAERHSRLKLRHRKMRMQFWEYFDRYL